MPVRRSVVVLGGLAVLAVVGVAGCFVLNDLSIERTGDGFNVVGTWHGEAVFEVEEIDASADSDRPSSGWVVLHKVRFAADERPLRQFASASAPISVLPPGAGVGARVVCTVYQRYIAIASSPDGASTAVSNCRPSP